VTWAAKDQSASAATTGSDAFILVNPGFGLGRIS
jgi:hypothetical protein